MNQQLENLYFLRDTVIPWMEKHPERVDFDHTRSSCGTYGCVIGWYAHFRHNKCVLPAEAEVLIPREFGLPEPPFIADDAIFGSSYMGALEDRKKLLNDIIARKEKELGVSKSLVVYRNGADIVRDMFREVAV